MQVTVEVKNDVYEATATLAKLEACSIEMALKKLMRRGLEQIMAVEREQINKRAITEVPVVRSQRTFTSEDVHRLDFP